MSKLMSLKLIVIASMLLYSITVYADSLKPFTSDGCSAFPDGTNAQQTLWLNCCQQHDFDYWQGGTSHQRLVSDQKLKMCVSEVGEPSLAKLMFAGVRVGGSPYFPTPFRWGYGWSYPRGYGALSEQELAQVRKLTALINITPQ